MALSGTAIAAPDSQTLFDLSADSNNPIRRFAVKVTGTVTLTITGIYEDRDGVTEDVTLTDESVIFGDEYTRITKIVADGAGTIDSWRKLA